MNYSGKGLTAAEVLNTFSKIDLEKIFQKYFQDSKQIIQKVLNYRQTNTFKYVKDLNYALRNLPISFLIKATQALRSFVNSEEQALEKLCEFIKSQISESGVALVITFNPIEEEILNRSFGHHQIIEPNINEIIKNPQSRSAKLHIYKSKQNNNKPPEKQFA